MNMQSEIEIAQHLDRDERLLWSGVPGGGLRLRKSDLLTIPFSIMWGGFAIFWEYSAMEHGPLFFRLWGIPFVAVGVYMMVGRFYWDAYVRDHTVYAVTDKRVIIVSGTWTRSTTSIALPGLRFITLVTRDDGSGDVVFAPSAAALPEGFNRRNYQPQPAKLEFLPNAREVYDIIRAAQREQLTRN